MSLTKSIAKVYKKLNSFSYLWDSLVELGRDVKRDGKDFCSVLHPEAGIVERVCDGIGRLWANNIDTDHGRVPRGVDEDGVVKGQGH